MIDDNYQWLTLPLLDMTSQLGWSDKNSVQASTNQYAVTGSGDIPQHASDFSFNKSNEQQQLRLKLHKKIQINQRDWFYEFGDIAGQGNELSGGGGLGRGFSWRNGRDSNQRFASHRFEGNAQPGWEAELYRNDALVDYQAIGDDGYYVFDKVPIILGQNHFKVVLYGPQGEQKVIEQQFTGHQLDQALGQWTPSFSVSQPKKRLMPLDFEQKPGSNINANISYGISDTLQASFGWNSIDKDQQNSQHLNSNLTGVWQSTVFNLASSFDPDNHNYGYKADFQSEVADHNINLSYQKMAGLQQQHSQATSLSMQGQQSLLSKQDNYSLSLNQFTSPDEDSINLNGQYSANFELLSLNNRWQAQKTSQASSASGTTGISGRFGAHQLRLESQYTLWPQRKIDTVTASYGQRFKSAFFQLRGNLRKNEQKSDISAQLSWNFEHFRLGARLLVDEQKNVNAALTFSMSLGVLPKGLHTSRNSLKRTATIKATAFMDSNNNGRFDQHETPVSGLSFKGNDQWTRQKTDEQGVVYLPGAQTGSAQLLEFNADSLDDPFLAVDNSKFKVKTHAGGINELYLPVYQTTEVEGEINLHKVGQEEAQAQAAVPLLLLDLQGNTVKRILSEFDGFFIFDGVKPGNYRIVVEPKYLQRKGLYFQQTIAVNASDINQDSDSIEVGTLLISDIELNTQ